MKTYTKKGDSGQTDDGRGGRIPKGHPQVVALGDLDELNSQVGLCVSSARAAQDGQVAEALKPVQGELMTLAAKLSGNPAAVDLELGADAAARMERQIDSIRAKLPPLTKFVIPAGCQLACQLHVARSVCRRAERAMATLAASGGSMDKVALAYVNRLSDLLFALARLANLNAGCDEQTWSSSHP